MANKNEEWRDVPGYEGYYQVSISTKEGKCRSLNKELKNTVDSEGRVFWSLYKGGKRTNYQAARWIAMAYPELVQNEWFEGAEIDHIDTDRLNNHPSNLRWVTKKGQQNNPLTKIHMSAAQRNRPDQSKPVRQYTKDGVFIAEYPSVSEAGRITGFGRRNISTACTGKTYVDKKGYSHTMKTYAGFVWKYKEENI